MGLPSPTTDATYRCAAGASWAVETRGIVVFLAARGKIARLDYPSAAIWDLASRGYRFQEIVELIRHIAGVEKPEAETLVLDSLHQWLTIGILEQGKTNG